MVLNLSQFVRNIPDRIFVVVASKMKNLTEKLKI